MTRDSFLPRQGATYVALVIVVGFFVIAVSAMDVAARMLSVPFFTLAALTLLSGSATVRLPSVPATISISETFVFTSVLLFGWSAGATIVALDGFIISIWLAKRRREFYRVAFNMAAPAISIWFAARLYYAFPGIEALYFEKGATNAPATDVFHLLPLLCFTLSHFIVNSWLIAFAVSFETRRRAFDIWRTDFLWLSLNYFGGASLSALLLVYTRDIGWQYIGIIVPLLLVLYFTFKIPMDRVKDTNQHLKKVNSLYISTIETLALAIDAKDQVTHGHIRRVQTYTVGLAQALGVRDDLMLRAIEASALLHDMGKLAIPEHILNKPGKLTPAEFEKMKMHASIGADILSSIEFPYPVVPIVRHHHENWDGSGYPTGIAGTAIPIGARILSVVDCFDALTSDRPYRPALTTEAALAILAERRGTMYDPLVVDTFVRIHRQLIGLGETEIVAPGKKDQEGKAEEPAGGLVSEMPTSGGLALFQLYQVLCDFGDRPWDDGADLVVYRLSQVLPVAACAVFAYEQTSDTLVCQSAHGPGLAALRGSRRRLGEGLSGWVAANRRPVINSIPALDLADVSKDAAANLNSTLSVPLTFKDALVGVFTVYATSEQAFSAYHRQVLEGIAPHVSTLVRRSRAFVALADQVLPGYPGAGHLDKYIRQRLQNGETQPLSLVVLQMQHTDTNADAHVLGALASSAVANLRGGDLVFVCGSSTLVCLLADGSSAAASVVQGRLLAFANTESALTGLSSAIVLAPKHGRTLPQLLDTAVSLFGKMNGPDTNVAERPNRASA